MIKLAPPEYMIGDGELHYIDTVLNQSTWTVPLRKWERMIPKCMGGKPVPVPTHVLKDNDFEASMKQTQKISKPPNSWILFRRDKMQLVKQRYPNATVGQHCKLYHTIFLYLDADLHQPL